MEADGISEKSTTTFRWINVVRYAVAAMMTVLIANVVVIAIKTVMRPDSLDLMLVGGSISVERPPGSPPNQLQLVFTIRADNPSGRAVMYYYNIAGYLFDKNISAATRNPDDDSFVSFDIANQTLLQLQEVDSVSASTVDSVSMAPSYFNMLYHNRSSRMDDVTLRMDGYLVTEPVSGVNRTARLTTYYCSPLVVGWTPPAARGDQGSWLCAEVLKSNVTSAR